MKVMSFMGMRASAYVTVLALLLGSVAASDEHEPSRLVAALLRLGAPEVGAERLPALRHSHVGDVRPASADAVDVSKFAFTLNSTTQDVRAVLSDLTISGLSSLDVNRNGKSLLVSGDLSIEGNYALVGTVRGGGLRGAGAISITATGFEASATVDSTPIDETKVLVNSVDLSVSASSIKINYEDLILDTSVEEFLENLVEH